MTKMLRRLAWTMALLGLLAAAAPVFADGQVSAALTVERENITVGDVAPLKLSVTHPAHWRVIIPALEKQWGDFEVRMQAPVEITANAGGDETTTQRIELIRFRPGVSTTPPLPLSIVDDQGRITTFEVAPVPIEVKSVLVEGDTALRDIKPQASLIVSRASPLPFAGMGLTGSVALGVYAVRRRRNQPVRDKRTPQQRALDTLSEIEALDLLSRGEARTYCVRVSDCLRDYVEQVCHIAARDLTTSEIAMQLSHSRTPVSIERQIIDVLVTCDIGKFANDPSGIQKIGRLGDALREIIAVFPPAPQNPSAQNQR